MNGFFLPIFNSNCYVLPWWQYVVYFSVIFFVWALRKVFSKVFTLVIYNLIHPIIKKIPKADFKIILAKPIAAFLVLFITLIILDKIPFPYCWNFNLFAQITLFKVIDALLISAMVISIVWIIAQFVDFLALIMYEKAAQTPDEADNQLVVFFKDFFKIIIWIIGILLIIKFSFKQNIGQLLTGLSLVGAALALATRESLENLIASFVIFFDKPFTTGDVVKVHNITGTIEHIGLRSTRIRTVDKTYVSVPNKQMVDSIVDNYSNRTHRRWVGDIECDANTPNNLLIFLLAAINNFSKKDEIEKVEAHISNLNKTGITVTVEMQTTLIPFEEFTSLKQQLIMHIHNQMQAIGITIQKP